MTLRNVTGPCFLAHLHFPELLTPTILIPEEPWYTSEPAYPTLLDRGEGCRVYGTEGEVWIDYLSGFGANILGYGHPGMMLRNVPPNFWCAVQLGRVMSSDRAWQCQPL